MRWALVQKRGRNALWVGTTLALMAQLPAWAETVAATAGEDAAVQEVVVKGVTNAYLAQNGVSATKSDTPLIETPQAVSVITQAEIAMLNVQTLDQALAYTSGAAVGSFGYDPRYSEFSLRGFGELGNGVYLDGLKMFEVDYISPHIEPYGMDRLEVVKGPTSVLYGQNAPGGLVNAISKRPQDATFGDLELQVGNFDRYEGRWDFNAPLTADGSVLARFTGLYRDSGTQYASLPDDEIYLAPALTWKPRDGTSLTLLADYQRNRSALANQFYAAYLLPTGYPQTIYKGQPSYDKDVQDSGGVGYALDQKIGGGWSFHQALRFNTTDVDYRYVTVNGFVSATAIDRLAFNVADRLQAVTLDNNVGGSVETGPLVHQLLFGVDYQHTVYKGREYIGDAGTLNYFDPVYPASIATPSTLAAQTRQVADQVGVYGQDQIKFGQHWALTASVRHDWSTIETASPTAETLAGANNGTQDAGATTGRVGLVYLSDLGLAPYVSYSTSFLPQSGVSYAGQTFDPLTGRQYEVGVRYQPKSGVISATLSVYDLTENNVLSTDPDATHLGFEVETGQARSRGVEFETTAHPLAGLNLTASYTYDDVRITKSTVAAQLNRQPFDTPANQASGWTDYTLPFGALKGLGLGAGVRYQGRSYITNTDAQSNGSRTFIDAMVHYDLGPWRAAINATNLADHQTAVCDNTTCEASRARTVIGSLKRSF